MGLLGKTLKGRTTDPEKSGPPRNIINKYIYFTNQAEAEKELKLRELKTNYLKTEILSEQKINRINKKKLMSNWRRLMRISKTGTHILTPRRA